MPSQSRPGHADCSHGWFYRSFFATKEIAKLDGGIVEVFCRRGGEVTQRRSCSRSRRRRARNFDSQPADAEVWNDERVQYHRFSCTCSWLSGAEVFGSRAEVLGAQCPYEPSDPVAVDLPGFGCGERAPRTERRHRTSSPNDAPRRPSVAPGRHLRVRCVGVTRPPGSGGHAGRHDRRHPPPRTHPPWLERARARDCSPSRGAHQRREADHSGESGRARPSAVLTSPRGEGHWVRNLRVAGSGEPERVRVTRI